MPMSATELWGGGSLGQPSTDVDISPGNGRMQSFAFKNAGLAAKLPDARRYTHTGGPIFFIANVGPIPFDLEDSTGGLVVTIAVNCFATVLLIENDTEAGRWYAKCKDIRVPPTIDTPTGSSPTPSPTESPSIPPTPSPSASPSPSPSDTSTIVSSITGSEASITGGRTGAPA